MCPPVGCEEQTLEHETGLQGLQVIGHLVWLEWWQLLETLTVDVLTLITTVSLRDQTRLVVTEVREKKRVRIVDRLNLPLRRESAGFYGSLPTCHPGRGRKTHMREFMENTVFGMFGVC